MVNSINADVSGKQLNTSFIKALIKKNNRLKNFLVHSLLFFALTEYSQKKSDFDSLIVKYSLAPSIVKSWQADINGCRQSSQGLYGIDTLLKTKMITTSEFFTLLGLPNNLTNEYGDKTNIGDTTICTYNVFANCKAMKDKDQYDLQMIVLFIDRKLDRIDWAIID